MASLKKQKSVSKPMANDMGGGNASASFMKGGAYGGSMNAPDYTDPFTIQDGGEASLRAQGLKGGGKTVGLRYGSELDGGIHGEFGPSSKQISAGSGAVYKDRH